jgi:hypothetical protein|tara:strand:- start:1632 stop:2186 length:555 start_codon:yes stop_codon:yes gene_type:complete
MEPMNAIRIALATALLCTSSISIAASDYPGQADTSHHMTVNYHYAKLKNVSDIDLSATSFTYGYQMQNKGGKFSFTPEFSFGYGVKGIEQPGVDIVVDEIAQAGIRLAYHPFSNFYVFIKPTVTKVRLSSDENSIDALGMKESYSETSGAIGVGFNFAEHYSLGLSSEKVGYFNVVTGSFRYRF